MVTPLPCVSESFTAYGEVEADHGPDAIQKSPSISKMFATQAVPVDACFAVTCETCGKTTWKVSLVSLRAAISSAWSSRETRL